MDYRQRKINPFKALIIFLGLILIFGFGLMFYWSNLSAPLSQDKKVRAFVVQKGEGAASVAERLEQEGFIKSSLAFKIAYKFSENKKIEAGDFKLSSAMSVQDILKAFSKGSVDKWVTLIEGWRVEEIASRLNSELGLNREEFLKLAEEGYMFPDTYLFHPEATPETVASILRNTFDAKYTKELQNKIIRLGLTPEQGVILASIVEREGRSDKVRTEVAGVLLKRFKMGMKLDADATVQYAKDTMTLKNGRLDKFWKPITRDDYTGVISPYNTYLNNGLPPAPICNPSIASLNAVANADSSTPYLFYYHDSKGNSYYAKTIEEHNQNVAKNR